MGGQQRGEAQAERVKEQVGQGREVSPLGAPGEKNPLAEAEVVAGHGADSTFEAQPRRLTLPRGLAALRHRDFGLYWGSQIISLVGTWMQIVAQSWLVLQLSNSPFILGALGALQFLPVLSLSIFGGVIADRLPRRQLLLGTQFAALALALALATLTQSGLVRIGYVMLLAILLGVVNAVDMPTRQAFVVELVRGEDLQNAIALNSAAFNSARLIGPAVAGLTIGAIGTAGCFYVNALSFLAPIGALVAIQAGRRPVSRGVEASSVGEDLREGLAYVLHNRLVWLIVLLVALVATFAMNLGVLIPVLARDTLHAGAQGFGFLTAATGVGSLAAAVLLAYLSRVPGVSALLVSAAALGLLESALLAARQLAVAAGLLAGIGFAMILFTTLANTLLQTTTPDALRGRVMSIYATVFAGTTPLGSLFAGGLAQAYGVGVAFLASGVISLAAAVAGYLAARNAAF